MKYTLRNLIRLPGKCIILFIIAMLVMTLSSFAVFVNRLCAETEARSFGPLYGYYGVTNADDEAFLGYGQILDLVEHSPVIADCACVMRYRCIADGLTYSGAGRYETTEQIRNEETQTLEKVTGEFIHGFMLVGTTSTDVCEEFYNGKTVMVKGRGISDGDNKAGYFKAVISDEVAELNGLSIGDTFDVNIWSLIAGYEFSMIPINGVMAGEYYYPDDKYATFTVGGIYHTYDENTIGCSAPSEDAKNRIYTTISAMHYISTRYEATQNNIEIIQLFEVNARWHSEFDAKAATGVLEKAYVKLKSGTDAAKLEASINEIGFYDKVKLTPFTSDNLGLPSSRLFRIMSVLLYVIMAAGLVILVLVLIIGLVSRRREFNCLIALGKRRTCVALSYFSESAIIILTALIISAVAFGALVSLFGESISSYLNAADSAVVYSTKTSASVLSDTTIDTIRSEKMLDFRNLLDIYIIPTFAATAAVTAAVLVAILTLVMIAIKRINVLRSMGEGKL